MKKMISAFLALLLICCMVPSALAADQSTQAADVLYELGLFKGTGTRPDGTPIYDLSKTPTRNQAIIMLVRLLGKEGEAMSGQWDIPFTDVSGAMRPYIGYAYANGLTNGYTATTYNGGAPAKANQYITFVLRALGYESGKDFEVASAWTLSDELGITAGQYQKGGTFTRGNVAEISCAALSVRMKESSSTLIKRLLDDGAVQMGAALMAGVAPDTETVTFDVVPNENGEYWFRREDLNRTFGKVSNFHVTEINPHITNIDTYLRQSEQLCSLIASNGQWGTERQVQYYMGDYPRILMLYSGPTTLRGFSIGVPQRMADGTDRYTVVLCDYSFRDLYQKQAEAFEAADYPYIEPSAVQTCGAAYFRNGYQMEVAFDDYSTRHQLYFLWMLMTSETPVWNNIQPISGLEGDVAYWQARPECKGCCYLLLDADKNPIGYTIIQKTA